MPVAFDYSALPADTAEHAKAAAEALKTEARDLAKSGAGGAGGAPSKWEKEMTQFPKEWTYRALKDCRAGELVRTDFGGSSGALGICVHPATNPRQMFVAVIGGSARPSDPYITECRPNDMAMAFGSSWCLRPTVTASARPNPGVARRPGQIILSQSGPVLVVRIGERRNDLTEVSMDSWAIANQHDTHLSDPVPVFEQWQIWLSEVDRLSGDPAFFGFSAG